MYRKKILGWTQKGLSSSNTPGSKRLFLQPKAGICGRVEWKKLRDSEGERAVRIVVPGDKESRVAATDTRKEGRPWAAWGDAP